MNDWKQRATQAAEAVYEAFMQQVVEQKVLADRIYPMSEEQAKRIANNTHINHHPVRLMSISGKGGWDDDPEKFERYAKNTNITLLDHLLSVVRGSLVLAALDWLAQNPDMDDALLKKRLAWIAVIAFMHDLDKDLELARNTELTLEMVTERMQRYDLAAFMVAFGAELDAVQLLYLLEKVEATQSHRHQANVPRETEILPQYVRLADKLDGVWVSSDADKGGIQGVLKRLQKDEGALHSDFLKQWQALDIFDPHHPFLLDELQRWLSLLCRRQTGVPPLLEMHLDGRLFMLLPADKFAAVVEAGSAKLCAALPFQLELFISTRGVPALYNSNPTHEECLSFIEKSSLDSLRDLFRIKARYQTELADKLDDLLDNADLAPRFPAKTPGASVHLYSSFKDMSEDALNLLRKAAHLILLLNLKVDAKPKDGVPDPEQREAALLQGLENQRPDWIAEIDDGSAESKSTRRVITALWVVMQAEEEAEIDEAVWEADGLLQHWLEGNGDTPGFSQFITGKGAQVAAAVKQHFQQLLHGKRIRVENEEKFKGRCLFTDQPVDLKDSIDSALGLYEVKTSAFSGRDNRPETVTSEKAHTNVSPVSIAEHRLRAAAHAIQGGKAEGVPSLISSPVTCGLFGGLRLTNDQSLGAFSLYDLSRQEIKKGKVLVGMEMYQARYRMARFERMANKTKEQVNQLGMMLRATRRIGRPIHIFRGLPMQRREFFYYDALPRLLAGLIGGNALRLEQLPNAIRQIELAQFILEAPGLGYDVLRLYATPSTRLQGVCLVWCDVIKRDTVTKNILDDLEDVFYEEQKNMSEADGALVQLGQIAAGIQKYVGTGDSTSEQMLVFKLCVNAVNEARLAGQIDEQSLIYAIAGELEQNLIRKGKAAAKEHRADKSLTDGCLDVAGLFVRDVWRNAMNSHAPSQKRRRILGSIYRMAFLQAHKARVSQKKAEAET